MAVSGNELQCATSCINGSNAWLGYANWGFIGGIIITASILIFFSKRLGLKLSVALKSAFLLFVFALLGSMYLNANHAEAWFHFLHEGILVLIVGFFAISYFFYSWIVSAGLKKTRNATLQQWAESKAKELNIPAPEVLLYVDSEPNAFVSSGFKKTIFISTGLVERLGERELRWVIHHELLHLKSGFLNLKRLLHSIRYGFFGLIPIQLKELDELEENALDRQMAEQGIDLEEVREKL